MTAEQDSVHINHYEPMGRNEIKMRNLSTVLIALVCLSCSQNDKTATPQASAMTEQEKADRLFLSVEEMRQMPEEALTKRAAALVMSKYVFIRKDSLYHVELTKEEAQKLGVDNKTYDGILAEIAFANKTLEEQRKQGNHIEMPDIRQIYIDSVSVWKKNLKKGIRSFIQTRTVSKPPKQEGLIRTHGNEF